MKELVFKNNNQRGAVLVIGLFVIIGLAMIAVGTANVGLYVAEKIRMQDIADASAYSAAVAEARYMNLTAYINRAMIANYDAMAYAFSVWSLTDAYDHGLAAIAGLLYLVAGVLQFIPIINAAAPAVDGLGYGVDKVHEAIHDVNRTMNDMFAQDEDYEVLKYVEMYNTDFLSMYQGLLYLTTQSARYRIIQEVAHKMDPDVSTTTVVGLTAETINADELAKVTDYVIKETDYEDEDREESRSAPFKNLSSEFNKLMGSKEDENNRHYLAAMTEASLNRFSAGRDREGDKDLLRNFNTMNIVESLLGDVKDFIDFALDAECYAGCAATLGLGDCDCNSDVGIGIGASQRWVQEDSEDVNKRVPIIAKKRMREVSFFGISINFPFISMILPGGGDFGHTSGEQFNDIRNVANQKDLLEFDFGRFIKCQQAGCSLNEGNITLSNLTGSWAGILGGESLVDDHWDGSFDVKPVCGLRYYSFQNVSCLASNVPQYIEKVLSEGFEKGVPKFDWDIDLDNVGFVNYIYPEDKFDYRPVGNTAQGSDEGEVVEESNRLQGPTVAVVAYKPLDKIRQIKGLGINSDFPLVSISRAQVYYMRNPNRPNEKPNLMNPHWAARLAPIDSDATPPYLRKVITFVTSGGVTIKPTH